MGGVLVDDHEAVPGLGQDIGLVDLRARRAERTERERIERQARYRSGGAGSYD